MTAAAADATTPPANQTGLVVAASAAGTAFEWYDFFIFGTLTAIITRNFFTGVDETVGFILALATFGVGFGVRPLGALFFGRIGDRLGRKGAFLLTITLMGVATVAIGVLPTYEDIGIVAPILLVLMRVIQGFALGGEYGGAAIYVAEHAPDAKRGFLTSWINVTAGVGLILALGVIFATRTVLGEETFADWGWRFPFILSAALLVVSLLIRMRLEESPAFTRMKSEQGVSKAPFTEAFARWPNLRLVLLALFAIMLAQGAVWYAGHFYAQFFLERVLKVPGPVVNGLLIAAVALSAPLYVFFGWLSDRVGRKPVMLFGMILFVIAAFPGFRYMSAAANPALVEASQRAPVVVTAAASDRSTQFDPLGRNKPVLGGDVLTRALADAGVPYKTGPGVAGRPAVAVVGDGAVQAPSLLGLPPAEAEAARQRVAAEVRSALTAAGYPAAADPTRINKGGILAVLLVFMVAATALYGPQAAALVELFPTRVRYTALSLPYHIGTGWVGGFLPFTAFAMVAATGDPYFGLWYPVVFTTISVVVSLFLLPETRGRTLD